MSINLINSLKLLITKNTLLRDLQINECINNGFRVIEIPVNYYPRNMGVSKISGTYIKSGVTALKMLKIILQKRFLYLFKK